MKKGNNAEKANPPKPLNYAERMQLYGVAQSISFKLTADLVEFMEDLLNRDVLPARDALRARDMIVTATEKAEKIQEALGLCIEEGEQE